MNILIDALRRPFLKPWRFVAWLFVAMIPGVGLAIAGLVIECMRNAEHGIPSMKIITVLRNTFVGVPLVLVYLAPGIGLLYLTLVLQQGILQLVCLLVGLAALLFGTYLLPGALLLAARRNFPHSLNPLVAVSLAFSKDYLRLWLLAFAVSTTCTIAGLAVGYATGNLIITAPAAAALQVVNATASSTIISYANTSSVE